MSETEPKNGGQNGGGMLNPANASPFVKWVIGQDSTVVVLIAFIALLTYGANRVMTELVPAHLQQIQTGYERAIQEQNETVTEITAAQQEKIKMITDAFTKEQERAEKRYEAIDARNEKLLERLGSIQP